jgi:hypothetical protein
MKLNYKQTQCSNAKQKKIIKKKTMKKKDLNQHELTRQPRDHGYRIEITHKKKCKKIKHEDQILTNQMSNDEIKKKLNLKKGSKKRLK